MFTAVVLVISVLGELFMSQRPSLLEAHPVADASEAVAAWSQLLGICQRRAPELLATWSCGVGPLLRFAVLVPCEQWLRDPEDWNAGEVNEVDMDGPEGPMSGLEALPKLESLLRHLMAKYDDAPMTLAGAFTWSDGAGGTLRERPGREVVLCSGAGIQLCTRFARLFAEVCRGERKPVAAAHDLLLPNLSKKMVNRLLQSSGSQLPPPPPVEVPESVRHVQPLSVTLASPLLALRRAQMETLGGPSSFAEALARTQLGKDVSHRFALCHVPCAMCHLPCRAALREFFSGVPPSNTLEGLCFPVGPGHRRGGGVCAKHHVMGLPLCRRGGTTGPRRGSTGGGVAARAARS